MKFRTLLAAGAAVAMTVFPGPPAHAAPALEGFASGVDPTGDTETAAIDIQELVVQWDLDEMYVQVETAAPLPDLSDPSWAKHDEDHEGRALSVVFNLNDSTTGEYFVLQVDGHGATVFYAEPLTVDTREGVEVLGCEATAENNGNAMSIQLNPDCLGNPGTVSASAYLGDASEVDIALAGADGVITPITDTVEGGYWLAGADGGVFSFGKAPFLGSMGGQSINAPIVGVSSTPDYDGYRLVASDGGIFAFGAPFFGSMGGKALNQPMVATAANPSGSGYWTVASDGGVFAFGDARFYGSMGGKPLNSPVVAMSATASGNGYWLFAADGGVFAFGDAQFYGSMGGASLNAQISSGAISNSGAGYRLVGQDGGVFAFGDATFDGGVASTDAADFPVKGITSLRDGYVIVDHEGRVVRFGESFGFGDLPSRNVIPTSEIVGIASMDVRPA